MTPNQRDLLLIGKILLGFLIALLLMMGCSALMFSHMGA